MWRGAHYLLLILAVSLPLSAYAALGGNPQAIPSTNNGAPINNSMVARKQRSTTPSNGYTIHESVSETGMAVREYASSQGIVFAVTWSGPSMPNLQELLGNYFPQFKDAMTERRSRGIRGPVMLKQEDLVVESRGHMGAFQGRAYVPNLLPSHISIAEIK